ncbi:uncharacterized protein LOC114163562 [Vigna unguiculata]|uniref:uncharacterized protein LOC114163562 n=1 Tax=Vigna unguiculata TaxID=3917 RepID=UPI0010171ECA|nr:uncharacterized protein LOC114163562 [Vigna unguiculata]
MVEAQRLSFIRANQKLIRYDILNGLQEAVNRGEIDPSLIGRRIVLPASFTGGTRYMFNNCQDAMAICKKIGYSDLFITITCNVNWSEIKEFVLAKGLSASDRPDIVCRVFKMKLDEMMTDFKKKDFFGKSIEEFQKRGLPHAHILLWLDGENKLKNSTDIDKVISAELPNADLYPKLEKVVSSYMIHGPCRPTRHNSPCMKEGRCSKFYPKKFTSSTSIDEEGYPCYKRLDNGRFVEKNGIKLDNRSVVPYNPPLLMRYQAHVNTEYCNKTNSIKYLFKYVNKGPDRATLKISNNSAQSEKSTIIDEIKRYYDCRYLSPCEAAWRIFAFDIHHRWPPVQRLTFHLPGQQSALFKDDDDINVVFNRYENANTMFLAWFEANKVYEEGKQLTYSEFPSKFVWFAKEKEWKPRKKGYNIGRLTYIPPGSGELYYLRILLTIQKGCIDYESIKTIDRKYYETYQEACYVLGLLADDKEYIDAIKEASLQIQTAELQKLCLLEIEEMLMSNGRSLKDYPSLPQLDLSDVHTFNNRFIIDELQYNKQDMAKEHDSLFKALNDEQIHVYQDIMTIVLSKKGGFFFLYGYGGTSKTFMWKTLSAGLRSKGMIVLNVASSGIASLLLPCGKIAHSTFCIPLLINDESTCNIAQGSLRAKLLMATSLIIWDEAPMMNRMCFEAFDRTLRDIIRNVDDANKDKPFGGKTVVLGGDFRQILPVIKKGSRFDIIKSAINYSELWNCCKVLKLSKNMRLSTTSNTEIANDIQEFADWILKIGDGKMDLNENGECMVEIPEQILITNTDLPLLALVELFYPQFVVNMLKPNYFDDGAISCPTNDSVEQVNDFMLSLIGGEEVTYLSSDTPCQSDEQDEVQSEWFTSEFLNDIKCSGIPNHKLKLKTCVPIMLLRNIDQVKGLCNGTRLQVNHLGKNGCLSNFKEDSFQYRYALQ